MSIIWNFIYIFSLFIKTKKICLKTRKKLFFDNMHKLHLYYFFDFFAIRNFQKVDTSYIKKLKDMK